jgi:site-specific recombinase XerD
MSRTIRDHVIPFVEYLEEVRGLSPHTVTAYAKDVRQFGSWVKSTTGEEKSPGEVTHPLMRSFLGTLRSRGYSPGTVARKLASLRAFFRYLQHTGVLTDNPASLLRSPKTSQKLPVFSSTAPGSGSQNWWG